MSDSRFRTHLLQLPSGGVVEVRKPHPVLFLGQGRILSPLLSAAAQLIDNSTTRQAQLRPLYQLVQMALVDPSVQAEDLPFTDLIAVYSWATSSAPMAVYREQPYIAEDFLPLVVGQGALILDAASARYSIRPSILAGCDDTDFAVDFDLAIAYRGLTRDRGQDEVEAEDAWGNLHKIPSVWQQTEPGRVIHMDDIAADMQRKGIKEMAFSTGGAIGCSPGEAFGEFNRFRQ